MSKSGLTSSVSARSRCGVSMSSWYVVPAPRRRRMSVRQDRCRRAAASASDGPLPRLAAISCSTHAATWASPSSRRSNASSVRIESLYVTGSAIGHLTSSKYVLGIGRLVVHLRIWHLMTSFWRCIPFPSPSLSMENTGLTGGTTMLASRRLYQLGCTAVALILTSGSATATTPPPPWQRTETRADCASFNVLRNPYFGDTHIHTTQSVDAVLFNTLTTPRQAYEFAQGASLGLAPFDAQGHPAHTVQLGRPLDFAAVTDHSEGFGTQEVCFDSTVGPYLDGYNSAPCQTLRQASVSNDPSLVLQVFLNFLLPVVISTNPTYNTAVAGTDGVAC